MYSSQAAATVSPIVDVLVDASRVGPETAEFRLAFATLRAESALGGPVALVSASAGWSAAGAQGGHGVDQPGSLRYSFVRSDLPNDLRVASVGTLGAFGQIAVGSTTVRQPPLPAGFDIERSFAAVERAGGAAVRGQWSREGAPDWGANAFTDLRGQTVVVLVQYFRARGTGSAIFLYEVGTGEVRRTQ
jgi:hypothetical protein